MKLLDIVCDKKISVTIVFKTAYNTIEIAKGILTGLSNTGFTLQYYQNGYNTSRFIFCRSIDRVNIKLKDEQEKQILFNSLKEAK